MTLNLKRDFNKAQLQERKAAEEVQWLQGQNSELKAKLKAANDETVSLQDKLL